MSYQNINSNDLVKLKLFPAREITDISLSSDEKNFDEETVFSNQVIAYNDGNRLPIYFDFSSVDSFNSQNLTSFTQNSIVSKNYWVDSPDIVESEICDIGLCGMDNGLVSVMTGATIQTYNGVYSGATDKFNRYKFDKRMKMIPITGFTNENNRIFNDGSYNYNITAENDGDDVGTYVSLKGGFYQGFYKLFGYDYEVFPERVNKGWTAEFLLRRRFISPQNNGLNIRYSGNSGIFFFMGTRAENKFYHYADGSPYSGYTRVTEGLESLKTCACETSGNTNDCNFIYPQSGYTSSIIGEKDPIFDSVSNAFAVKFSGDSGNPKICVRTYSLTGDCQTQSGDTVQVTGATFNEWCSTKGILDDFENTGFVLYENWFQIDIVFNRDLYLDECNTKKYGFPEVKDLYWDSIINESESLIEPPITHEGSEEPKKIETYTIGNKWLSEKDYRNGVLTIYVNSKPFMRIENFEEIIPRPTSAFKETQVGVPYTISIGGGTQGLHDSLVFSGVPENINTLNYQQDPELLPKEILDETVYSGLTTNIFLEEYFGGSLIGDLSVFRMYSEPLDSGMIRHNFRVSKDKYNLLDLLNTECNNYGLLSCDIEVNTEII